MISDEEERQKVRRLQKNRITAAVSRQGRMMDASDSGPSLSQSRSPTTCRERKKLEFESIKTRCSQLDKEVSRLNLALNLKNQECDLLRAELDAARRLLIEKVAAVDQVRPVGQGLAASAMLVPAPAAAPANRPAAAAAASVGGTHASDASTGIATDTVGSKEEGESGGRKASPRRRPLPRCRLGVECPLTLLLLLLLLKALLLFLVPCRGPWQAGSSKHPPQALRPPLLPPIPLPR